jgi:uncharacterized membrane protein
MVQARSFLKFVISAGALLSCLIGMSPAAIAQQSTGWRLCNETSFILEAAIGRPDANSIVVEGWTRLRPGECRIALPAPLVPGNHFVMARSSSSHRQGQRVWGGEVPLCADVTGSFAVESPTNCAAMGLEQKNFRTVQIENRRNWTTRFTEREPYGIKKSQSAGLQRLLLDAGIANTPIDGHLGRRTRGAIIAFLKANNLPTNTPDSTVMDILEEIAGNRARDVGMTICNRTPHKIWTAIGRRRGNGWESRGWWQLGSDACARAVDESLIPTAHYVFAEMETPDGLIPLKDASHAFCISRSKFAIVGRQGCEVRAYKEADFIETEAPVNGQLIYEFFERDFERDIEEE